MVSASSAAALCDLYLVGPFRFFRDAVGVFNLPALKSGFTVWFIPVILGGIFLFLLASANPLLEKWISMINPGNTASYVSLSRLLFWVMALVDGLALYQCPVASQARGGSEPAEGSHRRRKRGRPDRLLRRRDDPAFADPVQPAVCRSDRPRHRLSLGQRKLPADISYASYAHRGAYPLILTALLAAGFVLAAMRPGGPAEKSAVIRPLVYLWVAQNVLLVASSILRLDLYVQIYLLTWWRIAAFIWMLLVAFGLLLIVARIALNRRTAG